MLEEDLDLGPVRETRRVQFSSRERAQLDVKKHQYGASIVLEGTTAPLLRVELRTARPSGLRVSGGRLARHAYWSMEQLRDDGGDAEIRDLLEESIRQGRLGPVRGPMEGSAQMRAVRDAVQEALLHAYWMLDQQRLDLCRRFSRTFAFRVYSLLDDERNGHLAQLVQSCPGALIFALSLLERGFRSGTPAGAALLHHLRLGRPLNRALDEALFGWSEDAAHVLRPQEESYPSAFLDAWLRLHEAPRQARQEFLLHQRLLIRRAPTGLERSVSLWMPGPPVFAPEDIPDDEEERLAWYQVMVGGLNEFSPAPGGELARGFSAFLSKNATAFMEQSVGVGMEEVTWLWRYVRDSGRFVSRRTSLERLRRECCTWLIQEEGAGRAPPGTRWTVVTDITDQTPVPTFCETWIDGQNRVEPLRTLGDLVREGEEMHHCLATLADDAISGKAFFFAAQLGGASRLTIQLEVSDGNVFVVEIAGESSRKPMTAEVAALAPWFDALNALPPALHPVRADPYHYADPYEEPDRLLEPPLAVPCGCMTPAAPAPIDVAQEGPEPAGQLPFAR